MRKRGHLEKIGIILLVIFISPFCFAEEYIRFGVSAEQLKPVYDDIYLERDGSNANQNVNIGTNDLRAGGIKITDPSAPANPTSTGTQGDIVYDNAYIYICVADNAWRRAALSTWAVIVDNLVTFSVDNILTFSGDQIIAP